jgi:hypothetical protein
MERQEIQGPRKSPFSALTARLKACQIDRERMEALCVAGRKYWEIAEGMGICMTSVEDSQGREIMEQTAYQL